MSILLVFLIFHTKIDYFKLILNSYFPSTLVEMSVNKMPVDLLSQELYNLTDADLESCAIYWLRCNTSAIGTINYNGGSGSRWIQEYKRHRLNNGMTGSNGRIPDWIPDCFKPGGCHAVSAVYGY